jgi:hypothetical protein
LEVKFLFEKYEKQKQEQIAKQELLKEIEEKDAIEELLTEINNNKIKITKENEDKVSELQNGYNSLKNEIEKHKNQNRQIEIVRQELLNKLQQQEIQRQELLSEIEKKNIESMNLKSQYEVDINNYKKQLEDKIEAEQISGIIVNERIDNFKKLLNEKEYENQKILQDIEYEKQVLLEDMELLNEDKIITKIVVTNLIEN